MRGVLQREREREVGIVQAGRRSASSTEKPHVRPLTRTRRCVSFLDRARGPCTVPVEPAVLDLIRSSTIGRLTLRFRVFVAVPHDLRAGPLVSVRTRVRSGVKAPHGPTPVPAPPALRVGEAGPGRSFQASAPMSERGVAVGPVFSWGPVEPLSGPLWLSTGTM